MLIPYVPVLATARLLCSRSKEKTLQPLPLFQQPASPQPWKHYSIPSLDSLWDFKGAPNTSSQAHTTIHRKVHAKADWGP